MGRNRLFIAGNFVAKLGWVYLLPSETLKVIVKYHPKLMVSCALANTSKKITVVKRIYSEYENDVESLELNIKVPNLIFSHAMRAPWVSSSKLENYFSLHAIDIKQTSGVYVVPYRLANVYASGSVCFGDVALDKKPRNLRQANNYFWTSPFNEDNCPYLDKHYQICNSRSHDHYDEKRIQEQYAAADELKNLGIEGVDQLLGALPSAVKAKIQANCSCCFNECTCACNCDTSELFFNWIKNYYNYIGKQKYVASTNLFCGDRYFACPRPTKAVFLSNNANILAKAPSTFHRQDYQNTNIVLGAASQKIDGWEIDLGQFTFNLTDQEIEVI